MASERLSLRTVINNAVPKIVINIPNTLRIIMNVFSISARCKSLFFPSPLSSLLISLLFYVYTVSRGSINKNQALLNPRCPNKAEQLIYRGGYWRLRKSLMFLLKCITITLYRDNEKRTNLHLTRFFFPTNESDWKWLAFDT